MDSFKDIQKELNTLRSIFSLNEEQVNQLEQREKTLKEKLGGELNG